MSRSSRAISLASAAAFGVAGVLFLVDSDPSAYLAMAVGFILLGLSRGRWWTAIVGLVPALGCLFVWDLAVQYPYSTVYNLNDGLGTIADLVWPLMGFAWVTALMAPDLAQDTATPIDHVMSTVAWSALLIGPWHLASFNVSIGETGGPYGPAQYVVAGTLLVAAAAMTARDFHARRNSRRARPAAT
ncbi:hypothetical protein GGG17_13740 [Arsenicicoccus sp. MKL-02]|uniref:Apolipoprotein N-acyltransferase n=1 Tax=Arsenicicoccus cauae TaxID=2663847 RepID=A0A6I3IX20_9MICO|nr:hypothetical protein [Arsenicicoccus cauae]MTB73009.1 hypothetical protein [Arsenicicoccus cauae]